MLTRKMTFTILGLALLVLSILIITTGSPNSVRAQSYQYCSAVLMPDSGSAGDTVNINISGSLANNLLNVYWDWDNDAYARSKETGNAGVIAKCCV